MSAISTLPVVGLDVAAPAKPVEQAASQASSSSAPALAQGDNVVSTSAYPSPVFAIDAQSSRVIFEFRDAKTGEVTQQLPSKEAVRLYEVSLGRSANGAANDHRHSTST
jgi:hypothetical protein